MDSRIGLAIKEENASVGMDSRIGLAIKEKTASVGISEGLYLQGGPSTFLVRDHEDTILHTLQYLGISLCETNSLRSTAL